MSAKRKDATTILKLLRSTGLKDEISFSLQRTLKDLKAAISHSSALGNIPEEGIRVFHLGRELKTAGRSLEALGVGRMGITVLHVHASPQLRKRGRAATSKTVVAESSATHRSSDTAAAAPLARPTPPPPPSRSARPSRRARATPAAVMSTTVVDLLDCDSDHVHDNNDDDDDDCVIIDESPSLDRKRSRLV